MADDSINMIGDTFLERKLCGAAAAMWNYDNRLPNTNLLMIVRDLMLAGFCLLFCLSPAHSEDIFKPTGRYAVTAESDGCYLVMFTASWCGPCRQWKSTQLSRLESAGHRVAVVDIDTDKRWSIGRVPTFWIVDRRTKKTVKEFVGHVSADTLIPLLTPRDVRKIEKAVERSQSSISRWYIYRGTTYDLETYSRPGCHCPMCNEIKWQQSLYFQQRNQPAIEQPEHASPPEIIDRALDAMNLGPGDLLADLGCGTGEVLIAAVRRFRCRAIGIEIDEQIANDARRRVKDSGLSHLIDIITGDALNSCLTGVTCVYVYLYPDLLEKLAPQLADVPRVISPFHEVPGLQMERRGDLWVKG